MSDNVTSLMLTATLLVFGNRSFVVFETIYAYNTHTHTHTHTHTRTHARTHARLTALFPGLPRWAGTRKVKPIWILLKQETASGSGISWAICKSAPCSRQTTTPAPHHSVFYRPDALPAAQPTASKHWRHSALCLQHNQLIISLLRQWSASKMLCLSVTVCPPAYLRNCTFNFHRILRACCLLPWLGSLQAALRNVT